MAWDLHTRLFLTYEEQHNTLIEQNRIIMEQNERMVNRLNELIKGLTYIAKLQIAELEQHFPSAEIPQYVDPEKNRTEDVEI